MWERKKLTKIAGKPGLYRRPDGQIEAYIYVAKKSRYLGLFSTIKIATAAQAAASVKAQIASASQTTEVHPTFGTFAAAWLQRRDPDLGLETALKPASFRSARTIVMRYLLPAFGRFRMDALNHDVLDAAFATVAPERSPKYRRNIAVTLRAILRDALRRDVLVRDAAVMLTVPRVPKRLVNIPSATDVQRALTFLAPPYREAAILAGLTGMRQGELLSLTWEDVDLDAGTITVTKTRDQAGRMLDSPKTQNSVRVVRLSTPTALFLRDLRAQREEARQLAISTARAFLAKRPTDAGRRARATRVIRRLSSPHWSRFLFPADLAAKRKDGRLPVMEARNLARAFKDACTAAGLKMRFHDLRHLYASALLAVAGESALSIVASQLGHKSAAFTLTQYAHALPREMTTLQGPLDSALAPPRCPPRCEAEEGSQDAVTSTAAATSKKLRRRSGGSS